MKQNKMLICCDSSYFFYYALFGCLKEFEKKFPEDHKYWIKPPEEVDQNNLPDLMNCESFKRILKKFIMKRCESLEYYARACFQDEIDSMDKIDIIFANDRPVSHNFRKTLYPEYKAQRQIAPKSFNIFKIRSYVFDVLFKELELEDKYGYKFIEVEGAEGDDVIATIMTKCTDDYAFKILFASDRDFVQLENVHQISLFGKEVLCEVANEPVSRQEYLLTKILIGDNSDNIKQVFPKVGQKRALALVRDKELLNKKLTENQDAAKQYSLNKKLISFSEIPEELSQKIVEKFNEVMYENEVINETGFGNIDWL